MSLWRVPEWRCGLAGALLCLTLAAPAGAAYEWDQHLHGSDVRDLVATDDALWLATITGLVRMDLSDSSLTIFRRDERGMPSDTINALALDADGNLWCGTDSEGIAVRRAQGGWDFVRTFDGLPAKRVLALAARGATMIAGTGEGFAEFTDEDVTGCTVIDPCVDDMPSLIVQAVLPLATETWFGTSAGAARQGPSGLEPFSGGLVNASVLSLAWHEDELWCGTQDGPYRFDSSSEVWVPVKGATRQINAVVSDLLSMPDGLYAAVPSGGGPPRVYRWDGTDWFVMGASFSTRSGPQALAVDPNGVLWVGTEDGLAAWNPSASAWGPMIRVPGLTDPRPVWALEASAGRAWLGLRAPIGGSFDGQRWREFTEGSTGGDFENTQVQVVYHDHTGRTWFGHCCCSDPGCYADRLDESGSGDQWQRVRAMNSRAITSDGGSLYFFGSGAEDPSVVGEGLSIWRESFPDDSLFVIRDDDTAFELSSNTITGLAFDGSGRLWIGHRTSGVDVWDYGVSPFNAGDDTWLHMKSSPPGGNPDLQIISNRVLAVAARGPRAWVATTDGITLFENAVSLGSFGQNTLGNPFVTTIAITSDGSAWAGTPEGVVRFVPNALGTFDRERYRFPELTNDAVNAIATDGLDVWVATQRGIAVGHPVAGPDDIARGERTGSAYPNPFRPRDHDGVRLVDVNVPVDGAVFDAAGGLVAEFRDVPPGGMVWQGRIETDATGVESLAAPGIYAIVARAGDLRITARVALIR